MSKEIIVPGTFGYKVPDGMPPVPQVKLGVLCRDITSLTRRQWLEYRRKGIGGSDLGAILGVGFKSPYEVWADKTGDMPAEPEGSRPDNWFRLEYGNRIEGLIRDWYADVTGYTVVDDHRMYVRKMFDGGYAIADIDGFIEIPKPDGSVERAILEIKTTAPTNIHQKWCSGELGEGKTGKLPKAYELQVRHYMMVLNAGRAFVVCSYGNDESDMAVVQVKRDERLEACIYDAEKRFWEMNVMKGVPPETQRLSDESLKNILKNRGAAGGEEDRELSDACGKDLGRLMELDRREDELKAQLKDLGEQKNAVKASVARELGSAQSGLVKAPDGAKYRLRYRTFSRTTADVKKLKAAFPEIWEMVKKTSSSRPLVYEEYLGQPDGSGGGSQ